MFLFFSKLYPTVYFYFHQDEIRAEVRRIIEEMAAAKQWETIQAVEPDDCLILYGIGVICCSPHTSGSACDDILMRLKVKFPWGRHLWARGYWVASSGNVTDEVWKQYIEDQKPEEPELHGRFLPRMRELQKGS